MVKALADRFAEAFAEYFTSKLERIFGGILLMKTWYRGDD
jgi:cobalamin-dependent methionine synthase I